MADFILWSDLHCEFAAFEVPALPPDVDAVLIAGDTDVKLRHLDLGEAVARRTGKPVIMVWGNHEAYGGNALDLLDKEAARLAELHRDGVPLHVLHRGAHVDVADVRVVGATLWTDMRYAGLDPIAIGAHVEGVMNDYRRIRLGRGNYRRLRAADTMQWNALDLQGIADALALPFAGKRLVMTHHLPSPQCVAPHRRLDIVTAAYASDLDSFIARTAPQAWVYGHSHDCLDAEIEGEQGRTLLRANPRGYPDETTRFDPGRVISM
jgi:hypothetical protein